MLQNCYKGLLRRAATRAGAWVFSLRVYPCARARAAKSAGELESCELESWKLWLRVWTGRGQYEVREYNTLSELRAGLAELDGNYVVCEEHHGEEGQNGHTWARHYGKGLKA